MAKTTTISGAGGGRTRRWGLRSTVVVATAVGLCLAGCGGAPPSLGSVKVVYHHAMVSMDPHAHNDAVTGTVLGSVYDRLVDHVPGEPFRPALADSWTTPSDTLWRFHLRPGVTFHDGRPLRPEDVVSSLRRARFWPGSVLATYLQAIVDVRLAAEDPAIVEVETREPFPLILVRLSMVAIVPPEFDPSSPNGTGPYRWLAGSMRGPVELVRWSGYWGTPPPAGRVEIRFADAGDEIGRLVASGQADVVAAVSEDFVPSGWRVEPVYRISTTMLGLNVERPPLDDPAVREAIDLAIDRRALVASGLADGAAEPAVSVVPAEVFGFSPTNRLFPPDLERARRLLASRGRTEAVVHLDSDPTNVPEATVAALAASLRAVGLEVELHRQPYEELYRSIEQSEVDAFIFTWNFSSGDASEFLESMVHSRDPGSSLGLLNGSGYQDPQLDDWIEAAAREPVEARRLELLRWSLVRIANDRPYLPLYHRARLALVRDPFRIETRPGLLVAPADVHPRDHRD